jgi:trehalose 6-phosphate synthase/phosphatase
MAGKANLEVRPTFINKGEICKRLVATYNAELREAVSANGGDSNSPSKLEFILCMGDDFTDEDMFRALNSLSHPEDDHHDHHHGVGQKNNNNHNSSANNNKADVAADECFTVTVGASTKVTLARWHLLEPEDVIECVALLAGVGGSGTGTTSGGVLSMGEVNLAALSAVEDHIPGQ